MPSPTYLLSCDWGTSSFRLRLVETATGTVKKEVTSGQGIASMYAAYQEAVAPHIRTPDNRISFYTDYLRTQIQAIAGQLKQSLDGVPVMISGMASASIGMMELPYAGLPFALDGANAHIARISATDTFPHEVWLISGIKSEEDVMRGEETQLIGLASGTPIQEGICIFPGTHSKHVYIQNNRLTSFNTYMTGELFQTIASHTILKASVEKADNGGFEKHTDVFMQGVNRILQQPNLLHMLFTVRTAELFKKFTKAQNYYYLSGLLIGQEMLALKNTTGQPITLCCGTNLLPYYQTAIHCLGLSGYTTVVSGEVIDTIAIAGQLQVYQLNR